MEKENEIKVIDTMCSDLEFLFNTDRLSRIDNTYYDCINRLEDIKEDLKGNKPIVLNDKDYRDIIWHLIMSAIENRDIESARKEAVTFSEYLIDYDKGNITKDKLMSIVEGDSNS